MHRAMEPQPQGVCPISAPKRHALLGGWRWARGRVGVAEKAQCVGPRFDGSHWRFRIAQQEPSATSAAVSLGASQALAGNDHKVDLSNQPDARQSTVWIAVHVSGYAACNMMHGE